jgi:hypothetical protein
MLTKLEALLPFALQHHNCAGIILRMLASDAGNISKYYHAAK